MSHWRQSGVEESQLEDFAEKGFLPPKEVAGWRALRPEHEEPHLEPHIAGFVTLCEVFLGIEPHTSPAKGESLTAAPVSGFGLQRRPRHDNVYLEYDPANTNKGWHDDWFYIRNPAEAPFPKFHGERPVKDASWSLGTATPEKTPVEAMKEIIRERMVKAGLNVTALFYTMRERCVMPLVEQRSSMWLYSGLSDLDRAFTEELPEDEVWSWLLMVLKGVEKDEIRGLTAFDYKNPPNLVCVLLLLIVPG
ncbi:hypothetical protein C2845_PM11G03410 [Panicum miliaceum]|uniref:Uncharacterized protein n=1 Tax=Panicum miliaceum TaxID=4540 RepID=A0A3L6RQ87_PANMI|nr:hypothetical protein C2845_PM11G03410 [Panicum miliaceum]